MPFSNTPYYKKSPYWSNREKAYWLISPFGDGNCALYAFCCGLIDMIITDRLILDDKKFEAFKKTILENSLAATWKTDPPYLDELIPDILKFVECIHQPGFTFFQLKNLLSEQTHRGIAALALILAYPLRIIGVRQYLKILNNEGRVLLNEDKKLLENNSWAGEETLSALADYFGIPIQLISDDNNFKTPLPENSTPLFSLVNKNVHWNYLLPVIQKDGLAKILPNSENNIHPSIRRTKSKELLEENQLLLQELEKKFVNTIVVFCEDAVKNLSNTLKKIFHKLKSIFSCELNPSLEFEHATQQANIASKNSTEILNLFRKTWDKNTEFDNYLNNLGLKQIEKTLIKKPLIADNSKDAALASILQNAEIADFLYRNYTALTRFYSASCQTKVTSKVTALPTKPPHNRYTGAHDQKNADLYISRSI